MKSRPVLPAMAAIALAGVISLAGAQEPSAPPPSPAPQPTPQPTPDQKTKVDAAAPAADADAGLNASPKPEPSPAPADAKATAAAAKTPPPPPPPPPPVPDSALKKTIEHLRQTAIGSEPTATAYLDRIAAGHATPAQVNDFASYLTKRGMPRIGAQFQEYAVHLNPHDATLWLNLGTIRRAAGSLGPAASAFKKTIDLDAGNAMAHYSLGSVYDAGKDYDAAVEEYRRALVLDPTLADPKKNPQVINNEHLLAAKLQIYQEQGGSMGLPLLQMQKTPAKPPAAKPPAPHN